MDDHPLVTWLPAWRRARIGAHPAVALTSFGLGCVGLAVLGRPTPLVVYNASASAPLGLYRVTATARIRRSDLVLVRTPPQVRRLAADRGYLPLGVPLIKRVVALGGERVCVKNRIVTVANRPLATQLTADRLGRPLPLWAGCRPLQADEVFLIMVDAPASFDSRYFGPVSRRAILGRLTPLWLR